LNQQRSSDNLLWRTRAYVYRHFAKTGRASSVQDAAGALDIQIAEAEGLYRELHERHALFLEPGSDLPAIRMANPFSAAETDFRVRANGIDYWANCAWDSFGIPAALGADAEIDALLTDTGERVRLAVVDGQVVDFGAAQDAVVHILLPFSHWYDDLVYT